MNSLRLVIILLFLSIYLGVLRRCGLLGQVCPFRISTSINVGIKWGYIFNVIVNKTYKIVNNIK